MDWGLAKLVNADDDSELLDLQIPDITGEQTAAGKVMGTLPYMAPEQALGEVELVGTASDQYALGLILYEMVCGKRARPKLKKAEHMLAVAAQGSIPQLSPASPSARIRPEMRAIVHRATATKPDQRYADVDELSADVRRYAANEEVNARPDGPWQGFQRRLSNNRESTAMGVLVLLALAATVVAVGVAKSYTDQLAAQQRQEQLADFVSGVGLTAAQIDAHFADVEARVEGLAHGAEQLEEFGSAQDGKWYSVAEFHSWTPATALRSSTTPMCWRRSRASEVGTCRTTAPCWAGSGCTCRAGALWSRPSHCRQPGSTKKGPALPPAPDCA